MAEENPEQPKVTRRQLVKGAALGVAAAVATAATSCLPSPKETTPPPEPLTEKIKNQLKDFLKKVDPSLAVERVLRLEGAFLDTKEGMPVFSLPAIGSSDDKESPYKIGYLKGGLALIPSFQVTLNNKGQQELWEVLVSGYNWETNQLDEGLLECFEFERIPPWSKDRLEETLSENNKSQFLVEADKQQVALFTFSGILTQRLNEPIPSGSPL